MDEIRSHEWFKENLPKYLELATDIPMEEKLEINDRVISEVAMRMKVAPAVILDDMHKSHNTYPLGTYYVAYQLVADQMQIVKEPGSSVHTLHEILTEISVSPAINLRQEIPFLEDKGLVQKNIIDAMVEGGSLNSYHPPSKQSWYLGLLSPLKPTDIIEQVLLALQKHNFQWKVTGPFQFRCRHVSLSRDGKEEVVKLGLQLFAVPSLVKNKTIHLLDMKMIEGQLFQFFNLSAKLLQELRHLEAGNGVEK